MQVVSMMMLAMVASAVVSTVSMSALMVQRAQQAAAPSPAAALDALLNPPQPTPRWILLLMALYTDQHMLVWSLTHGHLLARL